MKPAAMRHSSTEDGAAWALSLLEPKHKLSRDLYVPSLVANVTKAHTKAHHIFVIILTQAIYKNANTGSDPPHCCFAVEACTLSFFAWSPRADALGPSSGKLLLYFAAAGRAVI